MCRVRLLVTGPMGGCPLAPDRFPAGERLSEGICLTKSDCQPGPRGHRKAVQYFAACNACGFGFRLCPAASSLFCSPKKGNRKKGAPATASFLRFSARPGSADASLRAADARRPWRAPDGLFPAGPCDARGGRRGPGTAARATRATAKENPAVESAGMTGRETTARTSNRKIHGPSSPHGGKGRDEGEAAHGTHTQRRRSPRGRGQRVGAGRRQPRQRAGRWGFSRIWSPRSSGRSCSRPGAPRPWRCISCTARRCPGTRFRPRRCRGW